MKKFALKTVAIFAVIGWSAVANAVPNYWDEGATMGYWYLDITNTKNQGLSIQCNVGAGEEYDNAVYFSLNTKKDNSTELMGNDNYSLLIDNNEVVRLPSGTNFRLGAEDWMGFTHAIEKARNIKVYKNNKLVATFTPKNLSVVQDLPEHCPASFYKEWK